MMKLPRHMFWVFLKILAPIMSVGYAFAYSDYASVKIIQIKQLSEDGVGIFPYFPLVCAVLSWFILTIRLNKENVEFRLTSVFQNHIIERFILVFLIYSAGSFAFDRYYNAKIERLSVLKGTCKKIDWQQFNASMGFRIIWGTESYRNDEGIFFGRASGRSAKVKAYLVGMGSTLCMGTLVCAEESAREKWVLLSVFRDDKGNEKTYMAREGVIVASPAWKPESGEPPMAISRAIHIAEDQIKSTYPDVDAMNVSNLQLARVYNVSVPDRWYYNVTLNFAVKSRPTDGKMTVDIIVLMDGTVVKPQ